MQSIEILNQHIDETDAVYRIKLPTKVGYATMPSDLSDEDTMCRPHLLIPKLPMLPKDPWTRVKISRSRDGLLAISTNTDLLPAVDNIWHDQYINVLSLMAVKHYRSNVYEVVYRRQPAIAKIAAFDWDVQRINRETWAYSMLDQYQSRNPQAPGISARVLGHLTENGRVMGILLEKITGKHASVDGIKACEGTLRKIHEIGLVHCDVNRYNFIVESNSSRVKLVDFEHAEIFDVGKAQSEIKFLQSELTEESGRGGSI